MTLIAFVHGFDDLDFGAVFAEFFVSNEHDVEFGPYFSVRRGKTHEGSGVGAPVVASGGLSVAFAPGLRPDPLNAFPVPPLSEPGVPISGTGLSSRIVPLAHRSRDNARARCQSPD